MYDDPFYDQYSDQLPDEPATDPYPDPDPDPVIGENSDGTPRRVSDRIWY